MVKYSFLVKVEETTITSVLECGIDFKNCVDKLDYRLRDLCRFKSYIILSSQIVY